MMGWLTDLNLWNAKVFEITLKWLKNTPTIKLTDNNRLILIDIVKGNYKRSSIQSWQEAALLLGLNQYEKAEVIFRNDKHLVINNTVTQKIES